MARYYAAIMALLAMLVVLLRAIKDQAGFDGTITTAMVWMFLFGLIGFVVGAIAQTTVDQSVIDLLETELAVVNPNQSSPEPNPETA